MSGPTVSSPDLTEPSRFKTTSTTDPNEFKRVIRDETPSVICMDLQMPDCDGIELLRFLFEQHCRAHVVLVSGVDVKVLSVATDLGAKLGLNMAPPLSKPLRVPTIRSALSALMTAPSEIDGAMLLGAFENEEITLHYQPVVDLGKGRVVGWEALARWYHPELGLIMPDRFIPAIAREGLMGHLTDRVLTLAVHQLDAWRAIDGVGPANNFVSVNFAATDLADVDMPDKLERLCLRHEVPPSLLRLELTETAAMSDSVKTLEVLTRLRVKGFNLAIDDFGTGYSSLVQLYRLPFSELKIDQTFVRNMTRSEEAAVIVDAIIGLGHALKLQLIAEGVETEEQATSLMNGGCELGQGYYFAKPMPAQGVAGWCESNSRFFTR